MIENKFKRRTYHSFAQFGGEMRYALQNRKMIKVVRGGEVVSEAFRERLMLAVTAVNGCRYCTYVHTKDAIKAGLSESELRNLLAGVVDDAPADELPALLYAQHWAEANANPDPETQQQLVATYGTERTEAIEMTLHMIRMGNLMGNQWDYFFYRLSFGRYGLSEDERN